MICKELNCPYLDTPFGCSHTLCIAEHSKDNLEKDIKDVEFYLEGWRPSPGFMAKWERIKKALKIKAGALHYSLQQTHGGSTSSEVSPKLQQEVATSPC